jgi:hypothetical protein
MSVFNPDEFLNQSIEGSFATRMTPVPEGEYPAVIDELKVRTTDKGQVILDVTWNIVDDALKSNLGRDKITVRQSAFLDLDSNGKLQAGENKNVTLGRIREAIGQNYSDRPWVVGQLKGAGPAKIKVTQRPGQEAGDVFNDVKGIAKIG